ncbi:MAG: alkaline phosphatase family protein [Clostridia bacterium]
MITNTPENIEKFNEYLENRSFCDIDIVDLMKYLAMKNGVKFKSTEAFEKLDQIINPKKNILLLLIDGMGAYKVSNLSDDSLFRNNLRYAIKTVNPTSTACVLSTIGSATYPVEHGVLGWWAYSKKLDINYYPLLFKERKTQVDLIEKCIKLDDIFKFDSIFDKFNKKANIYMKREYINSEFSLKFSGKKANRYGFISIRDGFKKLEKNLNDVKESFNYMYIDGLDLNSHIYGPDSKEAMWVIKEVENEVANLVKNKKDLTVIVVADHGQIEMTNMIYLNEKQNYLEYFYTLPSIDTRMISFFVKKEYLQIFKEEFLKEFGEDVILITKEEALEYNLFGNSFPSNSFVDAIGEYIAIIVNNKFMVCDKITYDDILTTKGNHSGLTKQETTIPLVVIGS